MDGYNALDFGIDAIYQPPKAFGFGLVGVHRNSIFKPVMFIFDNVDGLRKVPMLWGVWENKYRGVVNYLVSHFPFPPFC